MKKKKKRLGIAIEENFFLVFEFSSTNECVNCRIKSSHNYHRERERERQRERERAREREREKWDWLKK